MAYIDQILMLDESVVHTTRLHTIIYLWPAACLAASIAAVVAGWVEVATVLLAVSGLFGLKAWLDRATTELSLTDMRIIVKGGFLTRDTFELLLENIEGGRVDQSLFGRLFGYGTLTITGTGSAKIPLPEVTAPVEFWQQIQRQIVVLRRGAH